MKLINQLGALSMKWRIETTRSTITSEDPELIAALTASRSTLRRCANALDNLLIDAERDKDVPLLDQLADIREALSLTSAAGHAAVLSRIGHLQAESADHAEHSDFHSARYQRLRAHLTGILGVTDETYDAEILDMIRERATNAWLLTPDAEPTDATAPEPGSFRVGRHNPCNIWLDPDRDRETGKQIITMFLESDAKELVRSLNLFPAATLYTSGPAHRGGRIIYLNGRELGTAITSEWAQAAVDAMNSHYQSERVRTLAESRTELTSPRDDG